MRLSKDLPIAWKATLIAGLTCLTMIAAGAGAGLRLIDVVAHVTEIVMGEMKRTGDIDRLDSLVAKANEELSRYVIWATDRESPANMRRQEAQVRNSMRAVSRFMPRLTSATRGRESRIAAQVAKLWGKYQASSQDVLSLAEADPTIGTMLLDGADDQFREIDSRMREVMDLARQDAAERMRAEIFDARNVLNFDRVGVLLAAALALLSAFFLTKKFIVQPIETITRRMLELVGRETAQSQKAALESHDEIVLMSASIGLFQEQLAEDHKSLIDQNLVFEAVLSNIPHGVALYDAAGRLVINNEKHGSLYGVERWKPGATHGEILDAMLASKVFENLDEAKHEIELSRAGLTSQDVSLKLADGRTVAVSFSSVRGGGWVETHKDVTLRRQMESQIVQSANHDSLTGLPNRRLFNERLSRGLAVASEKEPLAVHLIDLDGFKAVNDRFGHAAGDALLVEVARRIKETIGPQDFCARLGGDEFVVVQRTLEDLGEAEGLAARLIGEIGRSCDLSFGPAIVGASIGIAVAPQHGSEFDSLLRNADFALYHAKKSRDTFRVFNQALDLEVARRERLQSKLRQAIHDGDIAVHFQPIFDVRSGRLTGFEALSRWNDAEEGVIAPSEFIPIAEECGLIASLDRQVLARACACAAEWPQPVRLAVNISAPQFRSGRLIEHVQAALQDSGLPPERLELEITETSFLDATGEAMETFRQLEALGVGVAIDDFGAGYSGLLYLKSFHFGRLKIDRSFVQELMLDGDSAAIVRAIVSLCRDLGIATVAEGIQKPEELERVRELGCDEAQGFLFSAARGPAQVAEFFSFRTPVRAIVGAKAAA